VSGRCGSPEKKEGERVGVKDSREGGKWPALTERGGNKKNPRVETKRRAATRYMVLISPLKVE
jgi:hypothetical protein